MISVSQMYSYKSKFRKESFEDLKDLRSPSSKGFELTFCVDTGRYTESDTVSIKNMQVGVDVHLARLCSIILTGLSASPFSSTGYVYLGTYKAWE